MIWSRRSFCRALGQTAIIATAVLPRAAAAQDTLRAGVRSAKTIYLINKTGHDVDLDAAIDTFMRWGRFAISRSSDDADLVIVFSHQAGMDKWGNIGVTEMDVLVKGQQEPAYGNEGLAEVDQRPAASCQGVHRPLPETFRG